MPGCLGQRRRHEKVDDVSQDNRCQRLKKVHDH